MVWVRGSACTGGQRAIALKNGTIENYKQLGHAHQYFANFLTFPRGLF